MTPHRARRGSHHSRGNHHTSANPRRFKRRTPATHRATTKTDSSATGGQMSEVKKVASPSKSDRQNSTEIYPPPAPADKMGLLQEYRMQLVPYTKRTTRTTDRPLTEPAEAQTTQEATTIQLQSQGETSAEHLQHTEQQPRLTRPLLAVRCQR